MSQKMKRKVNRGNRAKLNSQGFKVYKNFKLYIAKASVGGWSRSGKPAPRKELVYMVRDMWNNDKSIKAMRKHIEALSIKYVKTLNITGMWDKDRKKVTVNDNGSESIQEYKSTFVHEIIGHTFWDFARKWRREELIAFNKLANELPPVTTYVRDNEQSWRQINDDDEERIKFEKKYENLSDDDINPDEYEKDVKQLEDLYAVNGHDTMTRYANEQHSAVSEIIFGFGGHHVLLPQEDVNRLVELWERLHY